MSSFREQLLTDVSGLCQRLYESRLAVVRTQQLVSDDSKQDILLLILQLNQLRELDPFPKETEVDLAPLKKLKADIAAEDSDQQAIQDALMDWAKNVHTTSATSVAAERSPEAPSPINQRMIDDLSVLRSTIDKTRLRLLRNHDTYDKDEYVAARNSFTLARAVYQERLLLNQITATNAEAARMEQVITPAIDQATGATFPQTIQAGADFMSDKIFV
ncbi:hypothetical protein [Neolewinella persica]|uniref:hypothetical protein n=1 Tax=Neolewinella persica TaxID=70998 RepID=UPI0003642580|nr:hypothetical protein [Neolewinella persica]